MPPLGCLQPLLLDIELLEARAFPDEIGDQPVLAEDGGTVSVFRLVVSRFPPTPICHLS
jgi:hypothetical protein